MWNNRREKKIIYIKVKFWYLKNYTDMQKQSIVMDDDEMRWKINGKINKIKYSKTVDSNDSWICKCQ